MLLVGCIRGVRGRVFVLRGQFASLAAVHREENADRRSGVGEIAKRRGGRWWRQRQTRVDVRRYGTRL